MAKPGGDSRIDPKLAVPDDKAQYNFTDPTTKIMKANNKGFDQCGNAQAAVDRERQVIVAADVTNEPNDKKQLKPMAQQAKKNVGRGNPINTLSSDNGYFSEENANWAEQQGLNPHIATGRIKHNDRVPECPRGRPPQGLMVKERMARKLRTLKGRATYAQRKWIVEPVFGFIKRGGNREEAAHATDCRCGAPVRVQGYCDSVEPRLLLGDERGHGGARPFVPGDTLATGPLENGRAVAQSRLCRPADRVRTPKTVWSDEP